MSGRARSVDPPELGEPRGWTNGLVVPADARLLFIAGQTAARGSERDLGGRGMAEQWDGALANVLTVLRHAGGAPADVVRMTVFVTDLDAYRAARRELAGVWNKHFGEHYPAMSLVEVSGLLDPGAVVEVEATAAV